jgi:hypothetical protein
MASVLRLYFLLNYYIQTNHHASESSSVFAECKENQADLFGNPRYNDGVSTK